MREDLKKVLCEDARYRSDDHYHNYRHLRNPKEEARSLDADNDEAFHGIIGGSAARESIKQRYNWNWNRKEFGEHLSVLEGIVRKNEGRPWDKVYSEICSVAGDRSSATGAHIFQHLFDYIESKTFLDDGEVYFYNDYGRGRGGGEAMHISHTRCDFYVHPKTGCITRNKHRERSRLSQKERSREFAAEMLKTKRVISNDLELHKFDDVWFEIKFITREPIVEYYDAFSRYQGFYSSDTQPKHTIRRHRNIYPVLFDVLMGRGSDKPRVAISKRTLSHKELKQYGIV